MKHLLRYVAGMGLGAAAGMVIAKRLAPPAFGDKPRRRPAPGASLGSMPGRLGEMWKRAVDEGRRVMKQTEEELAKQVASTSDGLP